MRQRGRPKKIVSGIFLGRDLLLVQEFMRLRTAGMKYDPALIEACAIVTAKLSLDPITLTEAKRVLKRFYPRGADSYLGTEPTPVDGWFPLKILRKSNVRVNRRDRSKAGHKDPAA